MIEIEPNFLVCQFCGNEVPAEFRAKRPKLCKNCVFQQNFHTRKFGEIKVFYATFLTFLWYCKKYMWKIFGLDIFFVVLPLETKCLKKYRKISLLSSLKNLLSEKGTRSFSYGKWNLLSQAKNELHFNLHSNYNTENT